MTQLIIIGDESVRYAVFECFIEKSARRSKTHNKLLIASKSGDLMLDKTPIQYDVDNVTPFMNFDADAYINQQNLTVVVCIDAQNDDWLTRFDQQINVFKTVRGDTMFNILPVLVCDSVSDAVPYVDEVNARMATYYSQFSRTVIPIERSSLINEEPDIDYFNNTDNHPIVRTTLDVTVATPLYAELNDSIQLLMCLEDFMIKERNHTLDAHSPTTKLQNILKMGYVVAPEKNERVMGAMRRHFHDNRRDIISAVHELRNLLNDSGIHYSNYDYAISVFNNIVCSIGTLLSMLTLVGIPSAYHSLSQNSRRHGNMFSFYATGPADEVQEAIVDAEDCIERAVLAG